MPPAVTPTILSDELVLLAAERGGEFLNRLVTHVEPDVHRMVIARLNPRANQWHSAEEVAQEVLIAITSSIATLEQRTARGFRAFLSKVVDHKVADRIRQQGRPGKRTGSLQSIYSTVAGSSPARLVAWLSDSGVTPESAAGQAEQVSSMLACMEQLKDEYRRALTYAFFDQLKTAEIAERMQISRPAASMLLLRAVRALRARMTTNQQPDGVDDREPSPAE